MEEEVRERRLMVVGLIEKATNSTAPEVEPRLLKAIKSVVRNSDSELRLAAKTLMDLMKRDHSQIRYLSLLIIDELFMRSKLFRTLLVENLDHLLTLSVGFRRNLPLPAPPAIASVLRTKAIEFLEKWNASYGLHYRQLRLGFEYLKNTLRFQFPNLQANAARIQQERRERELRTKEILSNKFGTLRENFSTIKDELKSTVDEIRECLDIVSGTEENVPLGLLDDEEMEDIRNSELRQIRLDSLKEGEKVQETSENTVVFDALRELYKLLVTKHLVSVQEWISVLIRVEVADNRFRDAALKEFIDMRNLLQSVKKKCEESGCSLPNEEEDIWEEGTIEAVENRNASSSNERIDDSATTSTSSDVEKKAPERSRNKVERRKVKMDPERTKLLAEAPEVKWGYFLDTWGSNRDVMANQRGLELEGHWGRIDYDQVIPAEKIAELNVQATVYKEEPAEIPPCRAPIGKGKLCPRQDLRVCPFHGPIVPRDEEGNPVNHVSPKQEMTLDDGPSHTSPKQEMTPDYGPKLVDQLVQQAVKNVRDRDNEEIQKREHDKKALKRAKLAKIREHNDAMLRDAALASTSRSSGLGEDVDMRNGERSSSRNKKQTLASMLKKKVTPKDRLAQRLLNTRARDATTRQLTLGEDSKYREAFPNQW